MKLELLWASITTTDYVVHSTINSIQYGARLNAERQVWRHILTFDHQSDQKTFRFPIKENDVS